uniref:Uncharacterized protein n=1 Tax=Arundo donax TaxID=35708 RepID=A0A0A8YRJ8_ARUDO
MIQPLLTLPNHLIRGREWKYCNNYNLDFFNGQIF